MTWQILIEQAPGLFVPSGASFIGTAEEAQAHVEALQQATGICHAAQLSG